jgi:hypothetical protein
MDARLAATNVTRMRLLVLVPLFACGGSAPPPEAPRSELVPSLVAGEQHCLRKQAADARVCRAEVRLRTIRKSGNAALIDCYDERVSQMHVNLRQLRAPLAVGFRADMAADAPAARIEELWSELQSGACEARSAR